METKKQSKKGSASKAEKTNNINNVTEFVGELHQLVDRVSEEGKMALAVLSGNDALNVLGALPILFKFDFQDSDLDNCNVSFYDLYKRFTKAVKLNNQLLAEDSNVEKSGKAKALGHKIVESKFNNDAMKAKAKDNSKHQALKLSFDGTNKMIQNHILSTKKLANIDA